MRYGMLFDLTRCVGCNACAIACSRANHTPSTHFYTHIGLYEEGTYPNARIKLLPFICQQCNNASCVRACPTGASHYDEDGTVQVDAKKCIGCRMCMGACPYNARFFNWGGPEDAPYFPGQELMPFEKEIAERHKVGIVEKCTFCKERRILGQQPACVQTCPASARIFGDLDDPTSEISMLINEKHAVRRLEEYGTKPNVYYIGLN